MAENKLLISEKQLKTVLGEKNQQRQQSDLLEREIRTKAEVCLFSNLSRLQASSEAGLQLFPLFSKQELDAAASKLRAAQQTEQRLQTAING